MNTGREEVTEENGKLWKREGEKVQKDLYLTRIRNRVKNGGAWVA